MKKIKWAIVSTGNIANQFARGLKELDDCEIQAVCSRTISNARAFAKKYEIPEYYTSLSEMVKNKTFDIVYVGTPNATHIHEVAYLLDAGFNVLCEKPMGINLAETKAMINKAREKKLFLMEGMWTRFFPVIGQTLAWIREGRIGEPRMLYANFCYDGTADSNGWRFGPDMAGGALLDVGIYPLALSFFIFGPDYESLIGASSQRGGVDHCNAFIVKYAAGQMAVLSSAISLIADNNAVIIGTKGKITIFDNWWRPVKAELALSSGDCFNYCGGQESFAAPYDSTGFQYEAAAVHDCLRSGLLESPVMTLDDSLKLAEALELLKKTWY